MTTVVNAQGCGASTFTLSGKEVSWWEESKEAVKDIGEKGKELKGGLDEILDKPFVEVPGFPPMATRGGNALANAANAAMNTLPNSIREVGDVISDSKSLGDAFSNIGKKAVETGVDSLCKDASEGLEDAIEDSTGEDVDIKIGAGTTGGKLYARMEFDWTLGNYVLVEEGCLKLSAEGRIFGGISWQEGEGFDPTNFGGFAGLDLVHEDSGLGLSAGYRADGRNDFQPTSEVGVTVDAGKLWDWVKGD